MTNPLIAARDAFAAKHPEQRQTVNGRGWGVLHLAGQGPDLLLLPGTLGRADIFWQQIEALQGRANILSLSYPETGSLTDWAADIAVLMQQAGMGWALVLGTSLGGYLAQYLAGAHPDLARGLIAANTLHSAAIVTQFPPYDSDLDAIPAEALQQGITDSFARWQAEDPARADITGFLTHEALHRLPAEALRARLKALQSAPELPPCPLPSARIGCIDSGDDRLIPPPVREAVCARLAPQHLHHFPRGSHFPYLLHPQAYSDFIETMLQEGTP